MPEHVKPAPMPEHVTPAPVAEAQPPIVIDPVQAAWGLAVSGQRFDSYSQLLELNSLRPENADVPLRLYWLLTLQPELDRTRSRHDWLAAALIQTRLTGSVTELYRRELEMWPDIGLAGPYSQLLEAEALGSDLLAIASHRLEIAGLKRWWVPLDNDLRILARRAQQLDRAEWLSYLVEVMAHVSFDEPDPVYGRCRSLLANLRDLELQQSPAFNRIEELQQLARDWRRAGSVPAVVREVVRESWIARTGWRNSMARAAIWARAFPETSLQQFDESIKNVECKRVLDAFQSLLDTCSKRQEAIYPPGLIRGLVREFLLSNGHAIYSNMRHELLRFLVREAIDPQELIDACMVDTALAPRALIEHIRTDPTLRLAWRTAFAQ